MIVNKQAFGLSVFTVIYNIIEGILTVFLGSISGSIALIGFGLDSFIESLSGGIMIWRFKSRKNLSKQEEDHIEARAFKLVGYTFFILGVYILYESISKLINSVIPSPSYAGMVIIIISLIVMPVLYKKKHKLGHELGSKSLIADAKQTLACMSLSVAVLLGISMNKFFGFWQADAIAGMIVALMLFREGYLVLNNKELCVC